MLSMVSLAGGPPKCRRVLENLPGQSFEMLIRDFWPAVIQERFAISYQRQHLCSGNSGNLIVHCTRM
jgi:hypothetical protein